MIIGGLQKFSLLDYPGHISAIIFTKGCNFRCGFCYNPMLVLPERAGEPKYQEDHSLVQESDLFVFLEKRKGKLDGVVITGGEPTLHKDLPVFIRKIKDSGFKIKLDTNGTNPNMLSDLIKKKLVDYIAMDIKAPLEKYWEVASFLPHKTSLRGATATKQSRQDALTEIASLPSVARNDNFVYLEKIKKSIKIIINSGLPYEFRTTIVPGLHSLEDIEKMGEMIKDVDKWYLQQFKPDTDLVNDDFKKIKPLSDKELKAMKKIGGKFVKKCEVR